MDQSSVEVEVVRSYGGSDATVPSFNRTRYVYHFSVHEPLDISEFLQAQYKTAEAASIYATLGLLPSRSSSTSTNPFYGFNAGHPSETTPEAVITPLPSSLTVGLVIGIQDSKEISAIGLYRVPAILPAGAGPKVSLWPLDNASTPTPSVAPPLVSAQFPAEACSTLEDGFCWVELPAPVTLQGGTPASPIRYYMLATYYPEIAGQTEAVVLQYPVTHVAIQEAGTSISGLAYFIDYGDTFPTNPYFPAPGLIGPLGANLRFSHTTYTSSFSRAHDSAFPRVPLRAVLSGLIGAERGTQTLFFSFSIPTPARIGLLLVRQNRYEDQYISVSLHNDDGPIPLGIDGFARSPLEYPIEFERTTPVSVELGYVDCGYWQTGYAVGDCAVFNTKFIEEDAYGDLDYEFDSPYGAVMPAGKYGFTVSSSQWPKLPYKLILAIIPPGELSAVLECRADPQGHIGLAPLSATLEMLSSPSGVIPGRKAEASGAIEMAAAPTATIERISPYGS